jgi:hypothetical protein
MATIVAGSIQALRGGTGSGPWLGGSSKRSPVQPEKVTSGSERGTAVREGTGRAAEWVLGAGNTLRADDKGRALNRHGEGERRSVMLVTRMPPTFRSPCSSPGPGCGRKIGYPISLEIVRMTGKLLLLMTLPFSALAAQQPSNRPGQQPPVTIKAEKAEYRSQAKITSDAAVQTALARVPGGQIQEGELEKEHGKLVYSFDVVVPNRKGVDEVQVDARSGKVVSVKHESPAAEAKEKD